MRALPNQAPGVLPPYGLTRAQVDAMVWAIGSDGVPIGGAAAVSRVLLEMGGGWRVLGRLSLAPGIRTLSDHLYGWVASRRQFLSRVWADAPPF